MEVKRFEDFINKRRKVFRQIIEDPLARKETLTDFFKDCLEQCYSQFEEDTLVENFAEEYKDYLKDLKKAMGE